MPVIGGPKWGPSSTLGTTGGVVTWSITPPGTDITRFTQLAAIQGTTSVSPSSFINIDYLTAIRQAFDQWAAAGDIEFIQVEDQGGPAATAAVSYPDIRISFGLGDGPGGQYDGLAFYPPPNGGYDGDILLDTVPYYNTAANYLYALALHEIGHALGLDHVNVQAIMNPTVNFANNVTFLTLQPDDITGIRTIYGAQDNGPNVYNLPSGQVSLNILDGAPNLTVNGNNIGNIITGSNNSESINGLGGGDIIDGAGGDDVLAGGAGADQLSGGLGADWFLFTDSDLVDGSTGVFDWIRDFQSNADRLDVSRITAPGEPVSASIRAVQDIAQDFAILQVDRDGSLLGAGWVSLARIDGVHVGDVLPVVLVSAAATVTVTARSADDPTLPGNVPGMVIAGAESDDVLQGNAGPDTLVGNGGDDQLSGAGGGDRLEGGPGRDTLLGEDGDDQLVGGADDDFMIGATGLDLMLGEGGSDYMDAGSGNDRVEGGAGDDTLVGGDGIDLLLGQDGDDQVYGNADGDRLEGDLGRDALAGGDGDDQISGGAGDDYLFGGAGLDQILGGDGIDLLVGDGGGDRLDGSAGNDQLYGYDGDDIILGGAGSDDMNGGAGNDLFLFEGGFGQDTIYGFAPGTGSEDRIQFSAGGGLPSTFAEVLARATLGGAGTFITIDNNTSLTLQGISVASLSADDFRFG